MHACGEGPGGAGDHDGNDPPGESSTPSLPPRFAGHRFSLGYRELCGDTPRRHPRQGGRRVSNWLQRPLGTSQLHYAELDVLYLLPLYRHLSAALDGLQRRRVAGRREFEHQRRSRAADSGPEASYLRVRGRGALSPARHAVLRRLSAWRETEAMARDMPRRHLLPDEALIALAGNTGAHRPGPTARTRNFSPGPAPLRLRPGGTHPRGPRGRGRPMPTTPSTSVPTRARSHERATSSGALPGSSPCRRSCWRHGRALESLLCATMKNEAIPPEFLGLAACGRDLRASGLPACLISVHRDRNRSICVVAASREAACIVDSRPARGRETRPMSRKICVAAAQMGPIARDEPRGVHRRPHDGDDARGAREGRPSRRVPRACAHHVLPSLVDGGRGGARRVLRGGDAERGGRAAVRARTRARGGASTSATPKSSPRRQPEEAFSIRRSWSTRRGASRASTARSTSPATRTTSRTGRSSISRRRTSNPAISAFRCSTHSTHGSACASAMTGDGRRPTGSWDCRAWRSSCSATTRRSTIRALPSSTTSRTSTTTSRCRPAPTRTAPGWVGVAKSGGGRKAATSSARAASSRRPGKSWRCARRSKTRSSSPICDLDRCAEIQDNIFNLALHRQPQHYGPISETR